MTGFVGHSHKICAIAAIFLTGRHIAGLFFQKGNSGYFNFWVMWYVFEAKCCL